MNTENKMDKKQLLIDLCKNFERAMNVTDKEGRAHIVNFFIGPKPYDYFAIKKGNNESLKFLQDRTGINYYAEIRINEKCIFRESIFVREEEHIGHAEEFLLNRMLQSIFGYGVSQAERIINHRDNK